MLTNVFSPPPISQDIFSINRDHKTNQQNLDLLTNPLKLIDSSLFLTTKSTPTYKKKNLLFNTHINRISSIPINNPTLNEIKTDVIEEQDNYNSFFPSNITPPNIDQQVGYLVTSSTKNENNHNFLQTLIKEQNFLNNKNDYRMRQLQNFYKNNIIEQNFTNNKQNTFPNITSLTEQQKQLDLLIKRQKQYITENQLKNDRFNIEQIKRNQNYLKFVNSINNILPNQKQAFFFEQRREYQPPSTNEPQRLF